LIAALSIFAASCRAGLALGPVTIRNGAAKETLAALAINPRGALFVYGFPAAADFPHRVHTATGVSSFSATTCIPFPSNQPSQYHQTPIVAERVQKAMLVLASDVKLVGRLQTSLPLSKI
jgi:hypothetical protein